MIKPKYGVKCLHLGFDRYKRYCKLPVTVKPSSTTISFYVEKPSSPKGKNARVSNHHPNIQHYTDDGRQPWLTDNVSIEFIVPRSKEDKKRYRARVEQNASGTIQPFDVTTYQYDSTLIDPTDITTIFKAIIVFLNGGGYTDPFIGTPKQAKVLPRHSNIKPHRGGASSTPLTCSRNIGIDDNYLNEMTIYCLGDIIPLNENIQYNSEIKTENKQHMRKLRQIISETVKRAIKEEMDNPYRQVPNLADYIQQQGLQMRQASKFQRINARPAQEGERITTIASDGVSETTNVAGQGDWVVNNVSNPDNQWIIDGKTFAKKYVPVNGQQGVYMPKGGPMNAAQINEPISFTAPWGETMNIDKGGYILQDPTNPNDIYGISGKDFDNTYKFNENKTIYNRNISENKHYKANRNMKQTIRLKESELKRMIEESVNKILQENNGFVDGVKGAMNGFRGGWDQGTGIKNAIQGFRQGAQGQQQQSINNEQQQLPIYFKGIQGWANEAIKYLQQGNYEEVMELVDSILRNCQEVKNIIHPRRVGYENGQMQNQYWS